MIVGAVFAPIAATMAFAVTYEEWSHHGVQRRELLMRSLQMALVTLAFFAVLIAAAAQVLSRTQ